MKKIFTFRPIGFLTAIAFLAASCGSEKLSDVIVKENLPNVTLSLENKIEVSGTTNASLDQNQVSIPITIKFTGSSPQAFSAQLKPVIDTIATLVENGQLGENTVAIPEDQFTLPPVVNIAFGVNYVTFDLLVSRSFIERMHGKDIALGIRMSDLSKGNKIEAGKNSTIVVIKTDQLIPDDQVHYITFTAAGSVYAVPNAKGTNFEKGSQSLVVPLEINLSGEPGPYFTVELKNNPDTVAKLIASDVLKNTVPVAETDYKMAVTKVAFADGKSKVSVNLEVNMGKLLAIQGKKAAVAITLSNPSKFQFQGISNTLVVQLDPDYFRPYYGKPFIISGTIGKASEPILMAYYDFGGEGIAYHDDDNRDGGEFRRPDNVDIGNYTPPSVVGWTRDGEWLTYSVYVEADGVYEMNALIGSPNNDGRYSVFFGTENVSGILPVKQTPGAYGDQQPNISEVTLKKGNHILKFYMDKATYDVRGLIFTRLR